MDWSSTQMHSSGMNKKEVGDSLNDATFFFKKNLQ